MAARWRSGAVRRGPGVTYLYEAPPFGKVAQSDRELQVWLDQYGRATGALGRDPGPHHLKRAPEHPHDRPRGSVAGHGSVGEVWQSHRDDDVRPHGAGDTAGHHVDHAAVDEELVACGLRRKDAGDRHGGHDRTPQRSFAERHLLTADEVGGGCGKRNGHVLNQQVAQLSTDAGAEPGAGQQRCRGERQPNPMVLPSRCKTAVISSTVEPSEYIAPTAAPMLVPAT